MSVDQTKMVFRGTNRARGRNVYVTPLNSTNRYLQYARIILSGDDRNATFQTGDLETGFIVLSGSGKVAVGSESLDVGRFDGMYIPRGSSVRVSTETELDIAEFAAPATGDYGLQFIPYAQVSANPSLKFTTGLPTQQRHLNIILGKNVDAGRIMAGVTISEPGNWTSWPPHEHARMLEEMYVYFDMPDPAFGLQLVYNETQYPELVTVVRDGDAVLMPSGYHPNVSVPGHRICFLWAMAAHTEKEDRQFGVVNVQPGFGASGSGLEASRK
jgi:5-deoxy-glucuronate isomerase